MSLSRETKRTDVVVRHLLASPCTSVPRRFEGQVCVVTGAAQGIGSAVAARLAAEGARAVCQPYQPHQALPLSIWTIGKMLVALPRWILDKADGSNAAKQLEKAGFAFLFFAESQMPGRGYFVATAVGRLAGRSAADEAATSRTEQRMSASAQSPSREPEVRLPRTGVLTAHRGAEPRDLQKPPESQEKPEIPMAALGTDAVLPSTCLATARRAREAKNRCLQ
ncbi:fabG [Symbiodinium sp. CCMP2592]|nr:fabG [Symbiodinium sp. CCMP2592]